MATPEHTPEMEPLDNLTVALYRFGLTLFALAALGRAAEQVVGLSIFGEWYIPFLAASAALASANLHLYDPFFRWMVPGMSWLGFVALAVAFTSDAPVWLGLSKGFFYAGLGMMAVKEQFCFKIPGLMLVPVFLLLALILLWSDLERMAGIALGIAAVLYLVMVIAKWRMPLHFDIGNKQYYKM